MVHSRTVAMAAYESCHGCNLDSLEQPPLQTQVPHSGPTSERLCDRRRQKQKPSTEITTQTAALTATAMITMLPVSSARAEQLHVEPVGLIVSKAMEPRSSWSRRWQCSIISPAMKVVLYRTVTGSLVRPSDMNVSCQSPKWKKSELRNPSTSWNG